LIKKKLLLLGLSTGGPGHIQTFLKSFKKSNATIHIAQHMKEDVLPFFFKDLKESYIKDIEEIPVSFVKNMHKTILCTSTCKIERNSSSIKVVKSTDPSYYTPDINTLFTSANILQDEFDICAILLTGIGSDGVKGLKLLKDNGAYTIAESKESAPVFGMPRSAIEADAVCSVKSLDEILLFLKEKGFVDV